mgnify:CR=1 FL=1
MKNIKKYIIGIAASICLTQCDVLDVDPTGWYSENVAYSSLENVDLYVKGLYSVLYDNATINIDSYCLMDDGATDLLKYSWYGVNGGAMNKFFYQTNYVTETSNFRSNWSGMYTRIRQLNEYFYDRSKGYGDNLDQDEMKKRTAEVRFLRAFAYQELVLRHGGVILRTDEDYVDGPDERAKARSSESDCWDFIINEYTQAVQDLPENWTGTNVGRITKGAAYGMKARAALYAKRWGDAIDACNEVLKLNYSLLQGTTANDYYKIFTSVNNSELILPVYFQQGKNAKQHSFDIYVCPPYDWKAAGVTEGSVGAAVTPSDEYASSFDIKVNGSYQSFDWSNLSSYNNAPFTNREPRFYASILYNGATWKGRPIESFVNGTDGWAAWKTDAKPEGRSTTGYYLRKLVDEAHNFTSIQASTQPWTEIRYAEVLLNHAEACYHLNGYTDKANKDIKDIRNRVGLSYTDKSGDDLMKAIRQERKVELAYEGHYYWDMRRWKLSATAFTGIRLHGMKIEKNANGSFTYIYTECDDKDRNFPTKMYRFPMPQAELDNNGAVTQYAEWQ